MFNIDLSLFAKAWFIGWRVLLRALLGKEGRNKMLRLCPKINRIIRGWHPFLCCDGVLIVPADSNPLMRDIYKLDVYEFNKIEKDDVVVDVGAHVGIFTLKSAKRARLIIAVEPYPPNFKLLLANIRINRMENVIPVNVALGSYSGEAELYVSTHSGSHTISKNRKNYLLGAISPTSIKKSKVKLRTLDSIIQELGIKRVNFIKIDAEGAELDILKGANNTLLNNTKMKVAIASYHLPEEARTIRDLLMSKGFKIFKYSKGILHGAKKT